MCVCVCVCEREFLKRAEFVLFATPRLSCPSVRRSFPLSACDQVQAAQYTDDKEKKGTFMRIHKSFGTLMVALVVPRIALRLATKIPKPLPGPAWQHLAAQAGHVGLYGVMVFMPVSGIAMGYFGGKGIPFFFTDIAGAETPNGAIAKQAYQVRCFRCFH